MFAGWGDQAIRAVPIGVNGGSGIEFHRAGIVRAIEAVEVRDHKILRMHHFMQPRVIALFVADRDTITDDVSGRARALRPR